MHSGTKFEYPRTCPEKMKQQTTVSGTSGQILVFAQSGHCWRPSPMNWYMYKKYQIPQNICLNILWWTSCLIHKANSSWIRGLGRGGGGSFTYLIKEKGQPPGAKRKMEKQEKDKQYSWVSSPTLSTPWPSKAHANADTDIFISICLTRTIIRPEVVLGRGL